MRRSARQNYAVQWGGAQTACDGWLVCYWRNAGIGRKIGRNLISIFDRAFKKGAVLVGYILDRDNLH